MKKLFYMFIKVIMVGALLSALLGFLTPSTIQAQDPYISQIVHVISDETVKYSETFIQGWEIITFDDSTWLNVVAPSGGLCDPSIPSRIPDSDALPVWSQTPYQFQTIYARKTFTAAPLILSATIQTMVDDDFDLYVNGVLVRSDWDGVASYFVDDISALVQNGLNVIAIKASDTFGGCQHLGFDVTLEQINLVNVDIDIKPGSDPNSINCSNPYGVIPVVILSTDDFDATTVDNTTVTFEGASEIHFNRKTGEPIRHVEDVDLDGDMDLVFHFRLGDTALTCDSTEGTLTGETYDGLPIEGSDNIRMVNE